MSSFTYLSKAAVVLAAAAVVLAAAAVVLAAAAATATSTVEAVDHIRRLSSSSSEEDDPYQSEMDRQLFISGCRLVGMVVGVFILIALLHCTCCNPDDHQQASVQPVPKQILPLMSIEPALNITNELTFAGGADHPAECTVCLSEFSEGEEIRILSNCRHGFHLKCIETWLLSRSSCPTCRTSCVTTSVESNPPENQHDLEAANPPAIELMVLQQHR